MQEPPVRSLGQADPLEKGKATHSSILAWTGSMVATVHGVTEESDTTQRLNTTTKMTEPLCCIAGINTTLSINYPSMKNHVVMMTAGCYCCPFELVAIQSMPTMGQAHTVGHFRPRGHWL